MRFVDSLDIHASTCGKYISWFDSRSTVFDVLGVDCIGVNLLGGHPTPEIVGNATEQLPSVSQTTSKIFQTFPTQS